MIPRLSRHERLVRFVGRIWIWHFQKTRRLTAVRLADIANEKDGSLQFSSLIAGTVKPSAKSMLLSIMELLTESFWAQHCETQSAESFGTLTKLNS
jgi:hypothetical protein